MALVWFENPVAVRAVAIAFGLTIAPATPAPAAELATANGTLAIREAPAGQRSPACADMVVEARDALDNHVIGRTHAESGADGMCRYAITVPAQTAVWLHPRPVLVDADRSVPATHSAAPSATRERASTASVQLRFRIVAPETYFFAPGEQKTIGLTY